MRTTRINRTISLRTFDTPATCRFLISSPTPESLPQESQAEAIFIGRANVGKSSLLNRVMGRNDLVKTSAKPGHTQALNFFQVGPDVGKLTLVDAPGYGGRGRPEWGKVFEHYISTRKSLRRVFMLINSKHGFSVYDGMMLQDLDRRFKESAGLSFGYQVVLTKSDSVRDVSQLARVKDQVEQEVSKVTRTWKPNILLTSTVDKGKTAGIDKLREAIVEACR